MCPGSERKLCPTDSIMDENNRKSLILLELSASDDLIGFKTLLSEEGLDINESGYWYGRRISSKKMGFEERTPLMIASMFGSKQILNYILQTDHIDVNKTSGSDGATALHCAVAGGSPSSFEIVKLLLDNSADINSVDLNGNRPVDLITPSLNSKKKIKDLILNGCSEKKEYPIDLSFPDIKNGIYGTDEFRMYMFKVKPCSRAYSHDWTECPFVHPGENARRRDPRKYNYTNVPCPEFRKGTCRNGDSCEYAHGIFECWLHPAQYRTRLCKDETGCARKVCFFAHKPDELRPLYASTGSAVQIGSTPPMSPGPSSPISGSVWGNNQMTVMPPVLNLSGSRLKATLNAREMDSHHHLDIDPLILYQLQGLSLDSGSTRLGQSLNREILSSYPSSPIRTSPSFMDHAGPTAQLSLRSAAFAKRSQSFIDRGAVNRHSGFSSPAMPASGLSDWGSPNGKLDWGIQKEELSKLRKSASFGVRSNGSSFGATIPEPDPSWVHPMVQDGSPEKTGFLNFEEEQRFSTWAEQLYMEQEQMVV